MLVEVLRFKPISKSCGSRRQFSTYPAIQRKGIKFVDKGEFLFGRVQIVLGNSVKPGMRAISSVMLTFDAL